MRRGFWTALLILVIASTAATPAGGQSLEVIDFDDHPANPAGTPGTSLEPDFYAERGVRFSLGATVLEYDPGFASSGSNGLEMCYSAEFCSTPFQIGFDSPQQSVTVSVGYSGGLEEAVPVLMVAYDINGARLDVDETLIGPGSPVPIAQQLSVGPTDPRVTEAASDGLISAVEIRWRDATRAMNSLAIDDLVYEPFVPFVAFETEPTGLTFNTAGSFSEVLVTNIGNVPAVFDVAIAGDAAAIVLDDTRCREELAPDGSCMIGVGFDPGEEGEYTAAIVLISPQLEQNHEVPITGSLAPVVGPPPTTVPTGTTTGPNDAAADTDEPSATDDAAADDDATDTDEPAATDDAAAGGAGNGEPGSDFTAPLTVLIVLVAIGGGALLYRLRPGHSPSRRARNPSRTTPTVRVSSDPGTTAVTVDDRQPVTGIRVLSDRGTTTLMEEDRP